MTTQTAKLTELEPFYTVIFTDVKKDLRDDHLRTDRGFFKRNFHPKALNKITVDDFITVYSKVIEQGFEEVSEFISNRWVLRHLDIYNFFEAKLKAVNDKFFELTELEPTFAKTLMDDAVAQFGAIDTYIFAELNDVAFGSTLLQELRTMALNERTHSSPS